MCDIESADSNVYHYINRAEGCRGSVSSANKYIYLGTHKIFFTK